MSVCDTDLHMVHPKIGDIRWRLMRVLGHPARERHRRSTTEPPLLTKKSVASLALVSLSAAACGGVTGHPSPSASVAPRLTPIPSSVHDVPSCNLLMQYDGGRVFLDFVTPQTSCEIIETDVASSGPPFTSALTRVPNVDLASPTPLCLKTDFRLNGVPISKELIVLVNRNQPDPPSASFCGAWIASASAST